MTTEALTKTNEILSVSEQDSAIADILKGAMDAPIESDQPSEPDITGTETQDSDNTEEDQVKAEETKQEAQDSDEELTWAKALGVDESAIVLDDDGNFKGVQVKIDGKTEVIDLNEAIKGYQINSYNTQTSQKLAAEKKEFESLRTQAAQTYQQKLTEASKLADYLDQKLLGDFNIDWQNLRATDPAEYAARVQDYQLRQAEIQQIKQAINQELTVEQQQAQQMQAQQMQEYLKVQLDNLINDVPEWQDKSKMQADFDAMSNFVNQYGFTQDEFNSIMDARMIKVVKDAMEFRNGQSVAAKKLEKPLPKFIKSTNAAPTKAPSKLEKLVKAANKATGYNKGQLQDAAIGELLSGLNIR